MTFLKPFELHVPRSVSEAVSLLSQYKAGEAYVLAGGTDLIRAMKEDCLPTYPKALVSLHAVPGLSYIREEGGMLKIGAMTKLHDIARDPIVRERYTVLAEAARSVATPQIRYMGTIGGNLCQNTWCWYYRASRWVGGTFYCFRKGGPVCYALAGDNRYHSIFGGAGCVAIIPSDTAIALTALEARVKVTGPAGERVIPVTDLYTPLGLSIAHNELVTEVQVPTPPTGAKHVWFKFRSRKSLEFAVVSVAGVFAMDGTTCRDAKIALGAVAPVPLRAKKVEDFIRGKTITEAVAEEAGKRAVEGAVPLTCNAYKVEVTKALVKRAVLRAAGLYTPGPYTL